LPTYKYFTIDLEKKMSSFLEHKHISPVICAFAFMLLSFWPCISFDQTPGIVINEFLADNMKTIADADGEYSDWIELYNGGTQAVNLDGYSLTDNFGNPGKWRFPAINLNPGKYLLVWASGKNRLDVNGLHTDFKLTKTGEELGLYSPQGTVVDTISFKNQITDFSTGRFPDGGQWSSPLKPSPNSTNNLSIPVPVFDYEQGFYTSGIQVALSTPVTSGVIRYSLDASDVSKSSTLYVNPIKLTKTTVIRAATFLANGQKSIVITKIYLIGESSDVPILALTTDPKNLYDPTTGISVNYNNRGDLWERPVHASLISKSGNVEFDIDAGIRIHGRSTRACPKQSFTLYFRSIYGPGKLDCQVFPDYFVNEFDRLVIFGGSGDQLFYPARWSLIRAPLGYAVCQGTHAIAAKTRPAVLFLNGQFWGIYFMMEHIDRDFVLNRLGYTNIDLLKGNGKITPDISDGSATNWNTTYNFFNQNSFTDQANYQAAANLIDIDNFIDYMIIGIWGGSTDWPQNNYWMTRPIDGSGKWEWIIWDLDASFADEPKEDVTLNTVQWATRDHLMPELKLHGMTDQTKWLWATLMLRRLLENQQFKNNFINRFADLLNSNLRYSTSTLPLVDNLSSLISPAIPKEIAKWKSKADPGASLNWQGNISFLRDWAKNRPNILRNYISEKFKLPGYMLITFEQPEGVGSVTVSTLQINNFPWDGRYFKGIPLTIQAIPGPNYKFSKWSDPTLPASDVITIVPTKDYTFHPVFVLDNSKLATFQYDFKTPGWFLISLPVKPADSHLGALFPSIANLAAFEWNADKNSYQQSDVLSSSIGYWMAIPEIISAKITGEKVTFYSKHYLPGWHLIASVMDTVAFSNPNDTPDGSVLGFCYRYDPKLEKYILSNSLIPGQGQWIAVTNECDLTIRSGQTPGIAKSAPNTDAEAFFKKYGHIPPLPPSSSRIDDKVADMPDNFQLLQNYPNPFNPETTIKYRLPTASQVTLQVYDIMGRVVKTLVDRFQSPGNYDMTWDGKNNENMVVPSGEYFYRMQVDDFVMTKKLLFIK
jgi:hypothetical protein